ncbi:MAG: 50S ribosomal protein L4, partial [Candidatus Bathyarchaeia archaeon]
GILKTLGLGEELKRITDGIKVRPGRGKMRGRRYKERKGPLIIVEKNKGITRATSNLPGVEVTLVDRLNPEILAPGTHPGRLTIWSKSALKRLEQLKAAG